jgi:hypothetical protein
MQYSSTWNPWRLDSASFCRDQLDQMHRALYFVAISGRYLLGSVKVLLDILLQIGEIHS